MYVAGMSCDARHHRTKYGRNSQDKSSSHSIAHSEPIPGGGTGKAKKEGNLFTEQRNSKGELEMVQADSVKINLLMSQLAMNIQEEFSCNGRESFPVSFGTLIGSRVLSQSKPDMTITVMPLSVSSMDFRTEFETQGINQTKYKIYVILECRVKMLAPFSTEIFKVKNTVLVAETVILGTVPDSYVQVPKESILDAT